MQSANFCLSTCLLHCYMTLITNIPFKNLYHWAVQDLMDCLRKMFPYCILSLHLYSRNTSCRQILGIKMKSYSFQILVQIGRFAEGGIRLVLLVSKGSLAFKWLQKLFNYLGKKNTPQLPNFFLHFFHGKRKMDSGKTKIMLPRYHFKAKWTRGDCCKR